jgi:hypothetical protein
MKLRAADDGHNVYVLYSDLLFNLLILFLIIVLALVLRMNYTMRAAAQAHAVPETRTLADARTQPSDDPVADRRQIASLIRSHLDDAEKLALARADEAAAQRRAVDAIEQLQADQRTIRAQQEAVATADAAADEAKRQAAPPHDPAAPTITRQLAIAAGANRFSGRSGSTSMCVALDLSGDEPKYVLVNASAFASASSTLDGESDAQHKVRAAGVLHDAIDNAPRFSADELRDVFRALDVNTNQGQGTGEGQLLFNFSGHATMVASGLEDRSGNDNLAAATPAVRRMMNGGGFAGYHQGLINDLIVMRDALRPARTPQSVPVLHFAAGDDQSVIHVGEREYPVADFRQIVSSFGQGGIILEYDPSHGELCPDWIIRDVLTRTGYTNAVPDPAELKRLREKLATPGEN